MQGAILGSWNFWNSLCIWDPPNEDEPFLFWYRWDLNEKDVNLFLGYEEMISYAIV
jgi:hypothetical protein